MQHINDGDIYKRISLAGHVFEIRYGYYEEYERQSQFSEPVPIYPNFQLCPVYTPEGHPLVTQMQSLCDYGHSKFADGCCVDCSYFSNGEDLIGICLCPARKNPPKK